MKASEAKKAADKFNEDKFANQFDDIIEEINEKASLGYYTL